MRHLVLLLAGLTLAGNAYALDPFMWGVGPRIGTGFLPRSSPMKFPVEIANDPDTTLERIRFDMTIGVEGTYYINSYHRIGLISGMGFGKRYFDGNVMFMYDYVASASTIDFLFGGGVGFGGCRYDGLDSSERLNMPYYPFRANIGLMVRDKISAYQAKIYYEYRLPSHYGYTDYNGVEADVSGGVTMTVGMEISVLFGDFTPPRPVRASPPPPP